MPLTTFLGKPSHETQVITHPDGSTSTVEVTRDSPWDEESRQAAYDLYDDKLDRCPQCGLPREECREKDQDWFPQRDYCWRTAADTAANRLWARRHEKAEPDEAGYLPTDGARIWVAPVELNPDDADFLDAIGGAEPLTQESADLHWRQSGDGVPDTPDESPFDL